TQRLAGKLGNILPERGHPALLRNDLCGGGAQQRGLARAGAAHQGHNLALEGPEADIAQDREVAVAERYVTELQNGVGGRVGSHGSSSVVTRSLYRASVKRRVAGACKKTPPDLAGGRRLVWC